MTGKPSEGKILLRDVHCNSLSQKSGHDLGHRRPAVLQCGQDCVLKQRERDGATLVIQCAGNGKRPCGFRRTRRTGDR